MRLHGWLALLGLGLISACQTPPGVAQAQWTEHERHLIRMVRQDCGSCHGMRLTGGLGPPLTPEALRHLPMDSLVATIYEGRAGTPMPGWKTMISSADARWIAEHLQRGFPPEE